MAVRNGILLVLLAMLALVKTGCDGNDTCAYAFLGKKDGSYCMDNGVVKLTYRDGSCELVLVEDCISPQKCKEEVSLGGRPKASCYCESPDPSCDCEYDDLGFHGIGCHEGDIYKLTSQACEGPCATGGTCSLSLVERCEEGTECVMVEWDQAECLPTDGDLDDDGENDSENSERNCAYEFLGDENGRYCLDDDVVELTYRECDGPCPNGRTCELTTISECDMPQACEEYTDNSEKPNARCYCEYHDPSCDCMYGDPGTVGYYCWDGDIYGIDYFPCEGPCASGTDCSLSLIEECAEGTECVIVSWYRAECLPTDGDLDDDGEAGEGADESEVEIENGETDGDTESDTEPETDADAEPDSPDHAPG